MTKREYNLAVKYETLDKSKNLFDAYVNPSKNKQRVWQDIIQMCRDCDGWNLTVLSHNYWVFTTAFSCNNAEGELVYCIETKHNHYVIREADVRKYEEEINDR